MNPLVPDFILQQDAHERTRGEFEGAALFVDISGFTPLSARLMEHGRTGAEVLAGALRFHFDPLVDAVHDAGGFITGFAGDACTALFPQAPPRNVAADALGAAHRMQRFMAENPVYATPYGNFPFSIRVGLSWGRVGWGIVRVTHSPLSDPASLSGLSSGPVTPSRVPERAFFYFDGPAIDACAAVEHHARAGDVLLDAALRRRVPIAEATQVEGDLFRALVSDLPGRRAPIPRPLPSAPRPREREGPGTGHDGGALQTPSAAFLAPGILELPRDGEFRDVVSVFLSFEGGSDVPGLIRLLHELSAGYGGTFTGLDFGDKGENALIHFGAPVSHENDSARSLDFALELMRLSGKLARLRAGVTRDIRWVGLNGGTRRHEFACLGRATNLAARLMMRASWGEVFCDPKVFADAQSAYELEPRGVLALKGFDEPVEVHAATGKRALGGQGRAFLAKKLVGRDAETHRLLKSIDPVFTGHFAGIIHIDGEAGLGKSFLLETCRQELEKRGQPFLWLEAPCDQTLQRSLNAFEAALKEYFQQAPTGSKEDNQARFNQVLGGLVTRVAGDPALARVLTDARSILAALVGIRWQGSLYEMLSPKARFERTLAAITAWIRAESRVQPVLLHLEDAHWADGDTLRAVQAIARLGRTEEGKGPRLAPGLPVVIICTARYRDDGNPFRVDLEPGIPSRQISLGPLTPEDIGRLAENAAGRPIPDVFRTILVDGAGGNPFFAEEIFSYWCDSEGPMAEPSISSPSVALLPSDVNSLIIARLDRLQPRVKLTVLAAAVLGREFELPILKAMAGGEGEVEEHVRVAEAQRIVTKVSAGRYRFRNALLRNAAYEIQARARLQRLHQMAAEAIEAFHAGDLEGHFAEMARHYRRAGNIDKARPFLLAAAREAGSRYAHAEAKRHYRSYFKLVERPTPESVIARYELARDVLEPKGELNKAQEEHLRVIEEARLLGDADSAVLGRLGLGRVAWAARRLDEARHELTQALAGARVCGNRWVEALALAHLALVHRAAGLRGEARSTFEQSLRIGHALGLHQGASLFGNMVQHWTVAGSAEEALGLYEQAVAVQSLGV